MLSHALILTAIFLGIGWPDSGSSAPKSQAPETLTFGDTIKGKYWGEFYSNGWVYFMVDGIQIAMKVENFPEPSPKNGTPVTVTGCTPDPDFPGGYIASGMN